MHLRAQRLASGLLALFLLCACGLIGNPLTPPAPVAPPVVAPPPPVVAPLPMPPMPPMPPPGMPPIPSGLPIPPGGFPLPPGLSLPPGFPGGLSPGTALPSTSLLSTEDPPAASSLASAPSGSTDSHGLMTDAFLRSETETIYRELLTGLTEEHRTRVATIPFHVVEDANEPNAAAGCSPGSRSPMVMITRAMLVVAAATSEARSFDEITDGHTYDAYADSLGGMMGSRRPITGLGPDAMGSHATSRDRMARARHLFDEQIAFILGHELAHHYRGHTGCAGHGAVGREDAEAMARSLAGSVTSFEQPFEVEADAWGVTTVLEVGHERRGGAWTEEGALLSLDTFRRIAGRTVLATVFLSTHPPSELRAPIVRQIAGTWAPGRPPLPEPTIDARGVTIDLGSGPITIPIPR